MMPSLFRAFGRFRGNTETMLYPGADDMYFLNADGKLVHVFGSGGELFAPVYEPRDTTSGETNYLADVMFYTGFDTRVLQTMHQDAAPPRPIYEEDIVELILVRTARIIPDHTGAELASVPAFRDHVIAPVRKENGLYAVGDYVLLTLDDMDATYSLDVLGNTREHPHLLDELT